VTVQQDSNHFSRTNRTATPSQKRHNGFHCLARRSFGTKIWTFNYEEQAAEWYRLDRIFNDFYYALDELFIQPVCTFNASRSANHRWNRGTETISDRHMQNNAARGTCQTAVNIHCLSHLITPYQACPFTSVTFYVPSVITPFYEKFN
jgi:hypothetical protein